MVLYLLSCWCLWFLCLCQAKSELQVEFYVSDIQEVGDGFAVATLAAVRRRHLRAAWPRVAEASPPSPSVSRSVSCLHSSPLFLPFTQIIILTPVSVGAVSAAETYWRSTYSAPRVIFRRLVLISFIPSLSLMRLMHIFGDSFFLGFFFSPVMRRKTCGGGSGTVFNQGVSSLQVVKDTVNIQIGDVNDNAPTFHGQPYTVHIPEVSNQSINFYL